MLVEEKGLAWGLELALVALVLVRVVLLLDLVQELVLHLRHRLLNLNKLAVLVQESWQGPVLVEEQGLA